MIDPADAWTMARLLSGSCVNGEAEALPEPLRSMAVHLASAPAPEALRGAARRSALAAARAPMWTAMLAARPDRDELVKALASIDPSKPAPEPQAARAYATLEDLDRIAKSQRWLWPSWLASGVLNVCASEPGVGKTRYALDLARRLWFKLRWPDGQPNESPMFSRTLWIQSDQAFPELLATARDFGLPPEAVALGAPPDDPTGSLDLDAAEAVAALGERIRAAAPALVILDTVNMCTQRDLTRPEEARAFFSPLLELARETGTPFLGLTHLNREGKTLGRRIVEKARIVMMMTQPDPDGQPNRRRLSIDKSAALKPPALGITMGDEGNEYDFMPPVAPEPTSARRGPAPVKADECKAWLSAQLSTGPARVSDLRTAAEQAGFTAPTLYAAKDILGIQEYLVGNRKWWRPPGVS